MRQNFIFIVCTIIFILSGCTGSSSANPVAPVNNLEGNLDTKVDPDIDDNPGDNSETTGNNSPEVEDYKWHPDLSEPYTEITEDVAIESTNGIYLYAHLHKPSFVSAEMPCHGLILVPGGTQTGNAWHASWKKSNTRHWTQAGFIVIDFDFQGRGNTPGEEDWYGPVHREDLKAVIEYMNQRDDVLPIGAGIVTSSWGITVAAATLAENKDLNIRFLVDKEGSSDRYSSTQWDDPYWIDLLGNGNDTSVDEYWDPRESITFQPYITVPYIRIQSDMDHAMDIFYVDHAIALVNAAVEGLCPYVQLNNMQVLRPLDAGDMDSIDWVDIDNLDDELYMQVIKASVSDFTGK